MKKKPSSKLNLRSTNSRTSLKFFQLADLIMHSSRKPPPADANSIRKQRITFVLPNSLSKTNPAARVLDLKELHAAGRSRAEKTNTWIMFMRRL
jgi:hypothetical protein